MDNNSIWYTCHIWSKIKGSNMINTDGSTND